MEGGKREVMAILKTESGSICEVRNGDGGIDTGGSQDLADLLVRDGRKEKGGIVSSRKELVLVAK